MQAAQTPVSPAAARNDMLGGHRAKRDSQTQPNYPSPRINQLADGLPVSRYSLRHWRHGALTRQTRSARGTVRLDHDLSKIRKLSLMNAYSIGGSKLLSGCQVMVLFCQFFQVREANESTRLGSSGKKRAPQCGHVVSGHAHACCPSLRVFAARDWARKSALWCRPHQFR